MPEQQEKQVYPFRAMIFELFGTFRLQNYLYVKYISIAFLLPVVIFNPLGHGLEQALPALGVFGPILGFLITLAFFVLVNYSIVGFTVLQQGLRVEDADKAMKGVRMLKSWYRKMKVLLWLSMLLAIFFVIVMMMIQLVFAIYGFVFIIVIYGFAVAYRKVILQLITDIGIALSDESPNERFKPHAKWLVPYMYGMIPVVFVAGFLVAIAGSILRVGYVELFVILWMFINFFISLGLAKTLKYADAEFIRFRRRRLDVLKHSISDIKNT